MNAHLAIYAVWIVIILKWQQGYHKLRRCFSWLEWENGVYITWLQSHTSGHYIIIKHELSWLCVCLSDVGPYAYLWNHAHTASPNVLCTLPTAAAYSSSGCIAMFCTSGFVDDVIFSHNWLHAHHVHSKRRADSVTAENTASVSIRFCSQR